MFCLDRDLYFRCQHCSEAGLIPASRIDIQETGFGSARSSAFQCQNCGNFLSFGYSLTADETSFPNYFALSYRLIPNFMDILDDVKIIRDPLYASQIGGLSPLEYHRTLRTIEDLRANIYHLVNLDRRHFEQIVAELIRSKGFSVELTKKTRDGGRDIIGITNIGGIPFKLFVECKRKDPGNPVGVDIVRSVYGAHKTQDGPNKSIIVSTTYFSKDSTKFTKHETSSQWELDLYDFNDIAQWVSSYSLRH